MFIFLDLCSVSICNKAFMFEMQIYLSKLACRIESSNHMRDRE